MMVFRRNEGGEAEPTVARFRNADQPRSARFSSPLDHAPASFAADPALNYQRVIGQVSDIKTAAIDNGDGTYTYSFPMCHTAGAEDRNNASAAGGTPGTTIEFSVMIHKIHRGSDLDKADTYTVNGYGSAANFPDNFTAHTYGHVSFPSFPEGTQDCSRCHGADNTAWQVPSNRQHPTEQILPAQEWNLACGSCHDSDAEQAHMQAQTSPIDGAESCLVCHGAGQSWDVESMHMIR